MSQVGKIETSFVHFSVPSSTLASLIKGPLELAEGLSYAQKVLLSINNSNMVH